MEELATELPFSDQLGESPWKTPGEFARDSLRAIRRRTRKSQSEERKKEGLKQTVLKKAAEKALKQLAPAPDCFADLAQAKSSVELCIKDIDWWMTNNMLKLNQEKTELIVISSKFRPKPAISYVSVNN